MEVNYVEVKQYFEGDRFWDNKARKYSNMLCKIEEFVDINAITLFYPKNIFVEDKDLEIYLVFEDNILKGRILDDNNIEITVFRFKDIADFKCECTLNLKGFYRLTIKFQNGETVVFDSAKDTNASWSHEFEKQIKLLMKHIMKSYS